MGDNLTIIGQQETSVSRAWVKLTMHWVEAEVITQAEADMLLVQQDFTRDAAIDQVTDKRKIRWIAGIVIANIGLVIALIQYLRS